MQVVDVIVKGFVMASGEGRTEAEAMEQAMLMASFLRLTDPVFAPVEPLLHANTTIGNVAQAAHFCR